MYECIQSQFLSYKAIIEYEIYIIMLSWIYVAYKL